MRLYLLKGGAGGYPLPRSRWGRGVPPSQVQGWAGGVGTTLLLHLDMGRGHPLPPCLPGPWQGTPPPPPGPGKGYPHLELGRGTPLPTWTWEGYPLPGLGKGVPHLDLGRGNPPPPRRGVDWHTKWNYYLPHPSDAGGNYLWRQCYDDACDTALIGHNGVTPKRVAIPFSSNSIVTNETVSQASS